MSDTREKLRRGALGALALLVVGLLGWWVYVTFLESEENKVRRALASAVEAAEDRNPGDLVEHMTGGFKVTYRKFQADRSEVRQAMIRLFMQEYKHGFQVTLEPEEVPVEISEDGRDARLRFKLYARGKRSAEGQWIELGNREAQGRVIYHLTMRKTDEGWRMHRLKFEPVR